MADFVKTCANCGNVQATGDFCEKCGTRMPAVATLAGPPTGTAGAVPGAEAAAAAAGAAAGQSAPGAPGVEPVSAAAATPPPYTPPPYTAAPQGQAGPQYGGPVSGSGVPPYGGGPGGPGYPDYDYARDKGFFGRLFDLSFQEFITPSIIKILFIISMVVIALGFLGGVIFGFTQGAGTGVLLLIGGLVYSFLMLLYVRVLLELFIVFFRIHDNTDTIAKNKR